MQRSAPQIPCIALAHADDAYPAGADAVLLVPFPSGALRRLVVRVAAPARPTA